MALQLFQSVLADMESVGLSWTLETLRVGIWILLKQPEFSLYEFSAVQQTGESFSDYDHIHGPFS
jgi:hypothetical protein